MSALEKPVLKTSPLSVSKENALKKEQALAEEKFKPTGAFVFFILLVILGFIIWYAIYFLMLERI